MKTLQNKDTVAILLEYISNIDKRFALGNATEHTFRGDLQNLLEKLIPEIRATNEPKRIACGAPDYVVTRNDIPIGYIEAKDLGQDLTAKGLQEQFDRYRESLDNIVFTDYVTFRFYNNAELITQVQIGEIRGSRVKAVEINFEEFAARIRDFCERQTQSIKGPLQLAEMMADKAKILSFTIKAALESDEISEENSTLREQMDAFKQILIHDIDTRQFADLYAQTIAYGMFAARVNDTDLDTFSRHEAAELIPKSNPFLRKFFQYIAGYDLDTRIDWIVDALADLFRATDIRAILKNFGKTRRSEDPIIHFYESFLTKYDSKQRKSRGVFYTPEPVVRFIVKSVDSILKNEFNLLNGLADTSLIRKESQVEPLHKVQILDPATGTGTFLAEVISQIHGLFENQKGAWNNYVEDHLIPRLYGFELLMASYAIAHLKLELLLGDTGYIPRIDRRLQIYLTNALEEYHADAGGVWNRFLAVEANEANHIKRDTPVMVVMGNPPYSGESANKGKWIMSLMDDYKKEPGGREKLQERNPKWINADEIKFLRLGQHFVEKNGEGIVAFINSHGFLDNPTFRGMRWNLQKTYDKIFILDLHGNSKKGETAPDGSKDENVFDIQQGVSINIFVKTGMKDADQLAHLYHFDVFGKRKEKYDFLWKNTIETVPYKLLENTSPNYFMVPKDFALESSYNAGFSVVDLFTVNSVGVVTAKDDILIDDRFERLLAKVSTHYGINADPKKIESIGYRPFDKRFVYFDADLIERSRIKVMQHFLRKHAFGNVGLNWIRPMSTKYEFSISIANSITDQCSAGNKSAGAGISYLAPLYLYQDNSVQRNLDGTSDRIPNLKEGIIEKLSLAIGNTFTVEKTDIPGTFSPIDVIDYIYAVLHSPKYRERYKEFLNSDFPRVPFPKNSEIFWNLVSVGTELRRTHLMESPKLNQFTSTYPTAGNNEVKHVLYRPHPLLGSSGQSHTGDVFINENQYFGNVSEMAWNFCIGGYLPAQKWLKDRIGRELDFEDIQHYQKLLAALSETKRLVDSIDSIAFLEW